MCVKKACGQVDVIGSIATVAVMHIKGANLLSKTNVP